MIATHNIKVNGRWVAPGEQYSEDANEPVQVVEAQPAEEKKPEAKPRTASARRKNTGK